MAEDSGSDSEPDATASGSTSAHLPFVVALKESKPLRDVSGFMFNAFFDTKQLTPQKKVFDLVVVEFV